MSKGVAGVAGIGFVTLAAALSVHGGKIPVAALALLIGIDRFMSEARAVTSLIGNIVGTLAVARWVGGVDMAVLRERLADPTIGIAPHAPDPDDTRDIVGTLPARPF
jgi:aerobic C4-dicarboxylate transport protein